MGDIYSRLPVNKVSAVVTSQSGCSDSDELTIEQQRENLVRLARSIQVRIKELPKSSNERKALGLQLYQVNCKINAIRPKMKGKNVAGITVADMALEILREEIGEFQFRRLIHRASRRLDAIMEHTSKKCEPTGGGE